MDDEEDDQMKMDLEASGEETGSPSVEPTDSAESRPDNGTAAPEASVQSSPEALDDSGEAPPQLSDPHLREHEEGHGSASDDTAPRKPSRRSGGKVPPPPDGGLNLPPEMAQHWCFKVKEVAPLVQLSEKTIRREIWAGRLEVHKLGGSIRISRAALKAWLKKRQGEGDET